MNPMNALGAVFGPAQKAFEKRTERKMAAESADAALKMAKQEGRQEVTLTDAQWEALNAERQSETWKDEYVTVSLVAPLNLVVVGAIAKAFGHPEVLDGTLEALNVIQNVVGLDLNWFLGATVMAAIGLTAWRKLC
jgi:hypothetical protein